MLMRCGLPLGPPRPGPQQLPDAAVIRAAVESIAGSPDALPARAREPLLAWLRAWRRHWPTRYRRVLGSAGDELADRLGARPDVDWNRYLKMRRIAAENLAGAL